MPDDTRTPDPAGKSPSPIGDPPRRDEPVKTDADESMEDPFTEQTTHPAGEGQGANRPQPSPSAPGENDEEAAAVEEGFSPIP